MSSPEPVAAVMTDAQKYAAVRHYVTWALAEVDINIGNNPLHPDYFRGQRAVLGAIRAFTDGLDDPHE